MKQTLLAYRDSATERHGLLVADETAAGRRPGIVLFPDARGIGRRYFDEVR